LTRAIQPHEMQGFWATGTAVHRSMTIGGAKRCENGTILFGDAFDAPVDNPNRSVRGAHCEM